MTEHMGENIVLIVCDTLSAFHLPFYGYEKDTAPFLSKLAEDNCLFTYAYSNAPWTIPSHASLFTGKFPHDHGTKAEHLKFTGKSFVEQLSKEGYTTYGFSNNALVGPTLGFDSGFDTFYSDADIGLGTTGMPAMREVRQNIAQGKYESDTEKYVDALRKAFKHRDLKSVVGHCKELLASRGIIDLPGNGAETTNRLVRDELADEDDSFFLFINYMEAHFPYNPPDTYVSTDMADSARSYLDNLDRDDPFGVEMLQKDVPDHVREGMTALYDGEIRCLDSEIKKLYSYIMREFPDTTVIITGDHGELIGEQGRYGHQFGIHEKLIRVPLIIADNHVEPQTITDRYVQINELRDFILGKKDVDELGTETAYAEYHGYEGFYERWGSRDIADFSDDILQYFKNRAVGVIQNGQGRIKSTQLPSTAFTLHPDRFTDHEQVESHPLDEKILDHPFPYTQEPEPVPTDIDI